jgi:hypothetical protein
MQFAVACTYLWQRLSFEQPTEVPHDLVELWRHELTHWAVLKRRDDVVTKHRRTVRHHLPIDSNQHTYNRSMLRAQAHSSTVSDSLVNTALFQ